MCDGGTTRGSPRQLDDPGDSEFVDLVSCKPHHLGQHIVGVFTQSWCTGRSFRWLTGDPGKWRLLSNRSDHRIVDDQDVAPGQYMLVRRKVGRVIGGTHDHIVLDT